MSLTRFATVAGLAVIAVTMLRSDAYQRVALAWSAGRLAMDALSEMNDSNRN